MQSFSASLSEHWLLALGLLVALVAILVVVFLLRGVIFGGRLNMAGAARARQPRLGVVDAFDLDRQRQLVLIRRDNIEHLIMIGGPNDLLIEQAIVRAQPSVAMPTRDKDGSPTLPLMPPSGPGTPAPASVMPPTIALPDPAPSPAVARQEPVVPKPVADALRPSNPPEARTPAAPAPRTAPLRQPGTPPSPRPVPPPRNGSTSATPPTPRATPTIPRPSPLSRVTSAATARPEAGSPVDETPKAAGTSPSTPPAPAPASEVPPAEAPSIPPPNASPSAPEPHVAEPAATVPAAAPEVAPPVSPETKPQTPTLPTTLDTLESLEEEMAKLLGRSVDKS